MEHSKYATSGGYERKREKECERKLGLDDDGVYMIQGTTDYKPIDGPMKHELEALLEKLLPTVNLGRFEYRCLKLRRNEQGTSISYYAPIIAVRARWLQKSNTTRRFPIIRGTRTLLEGDNEGAKEAALEDLVEVLKKFAIWDQAKDDFDIALTFNWSVDVTVPFGWGDHGP